MTKIKSFIQLMEEETKSVAVLFGRMNPPTAGHEENVNGLKNLAVKHNADHLVIASHSHDPKKNPLSPEDKMKHLKRAFPGTNVKVASKESPTILHHAADLHRQGYTHLIVAGGGDRAEEYKRLLNQYNGKEGKHGFYNFKKITVASTGERKAGVSGTDMRNHVKNNNFEGFRENLPSNIRNNNKHAMELFHDVKKGMNIHENVNRGMFKALFLVGGPGSGKDVIVREAVSERNAVEINVGKAYDLLIDKGKLAEDTKDGQLSAIRKRTALIINGASDDNDKVTRIKEELEELGYTTMMVFVNTTNEVSYNRNQQHSRVISENIRMEKWQKSQDNINYFYELFDYFLEFDNSFNKEKSNIILKEEKENEISLIANEISHFFKMKVTNENANDWLRINNKLDINKDIQSLFLGEQRGPHDNYTDIRKKHNHKNYKSLVGKNKNVLQAGNSYIDNFLRKSGKIDDVRDGDINKQNGYTFRTYEETSLQQESEPTLKINPEPKTKKFDTDKESAKFKRKAGVDLLPGKVINGTGVGPTWDNRTSGTVYPMSGLGNASYRESFNKFRNKMKKESIDSPSTEMGTFGGMANGTNKEPMVTPSDRANTQVSPKKRIKEQEGAGQTPESLAKKHGVSVKSINKQLDIGTSVEHEHTKNNEKARKIAMDHVTELPDYYSRLTKMEKQAKKQEKK